MAEKTRIISGILFLTCISIWFLFAFAAVAQATGTSTPSWWEHVDLMQVVIGSLIALVLWFTARTLKKIDANQTVMFRMIDELRKEFYQLKGEHEAIKARCGDKE